MKQREIKFRVWDNVEYMSNPFTLYDLMGSGARLQFTRDCVVMQYTGLKDSHGKEIYEGDILAGDLGKAMVVYWDPEEACFFMRESGKTAYTLSQQEARLFTSIIGNIYEHPHLIKP